MDWQVKMDHALDYIEEHLSDEIQLEAAAKCAGCSVWEFQRLFSFVSHTSAGRVCPQEETHARGGRPSQRR